MEVHAGVEPANNGFADRSLSRLGNEPFTFIYWWVGMDLNHRSPKTGDLQSPAIDQLCHLPILGAGPGFEPGALAYETKMLPLHYPDTI